MVRKGSLKPRQLISLIDELSLIAEDSSLGTDAVQLRIRRAEKLLENLTALWFTTSGDIREKKMDVASLKYWLEYCSVEESLRSTRYVIDTLEKIMDEKYYRHHGRATEKHRSIREQEDQIRILRHKVVHQVNSLAAERKLIKDVKNVEENIAKIIVNVTNNWHRLNTIEDIENHIKVCKAEMTQTSKRKHRQTWISGRIERTYKNLRFMEDDLIVLEKELKKINEMEVEILSLIHSLEVQLLQQEE